MKLAGLLLLVLTLPTAVLAQASPSGFSALGGAISVAARTGAPEIMAGYLLTEWPSWLHMGHGSLVGLAGTKAGGTLGFGAGHRWDDYTSPTGLRTSLTLGVAWCVPMKATKGLLSGEARLFVLVAFLPKEKAR